jgi:hypothetical protein
MLSLCDPFPCCCCSLLYTPHYPRRHGEIDVSRPSSVGAAEASSIESFRIAVSKSKGMRFVFLLQPLISFHFINSRSEI